MDEKGLGRRLQAARREAGFTQQSLCHAAGLSYSTLAKIERGAIKSPSIFTIQSISNALGVSLDALLGTVSPTPTQPKLVAKNGVRFVFFDINGCLVHFFYGAFAKLSIACGQPAEVVESAFWHYNDDVCAGKITVEEFNFALAKRLQVAPFDWRDYYIDSVESIEVMRELVVWTAERYYVGLFSNIIPGEIEALRAHKLLPSVSYDAIIDSSVVGSIKPEKQIYDVATSRSGVKPEEILLIDDTQANLRAAERMGWHVLRFDDYRPEESVARIRETLEPS